jgi:pSer/pThr/pTyr-binding forkhead associated (FHA) protein
VYFLKDGDKLHKLAVGVNSVGRLPDNQVVLADDHVSRRHCAVVVHSDGRCELHDIASKNGTLLNGKKISAPTPINTGDQISLCGKMLELVEAQ